MIFRREMMPSWIVRSAFCISCSTPSMRNRTVSWFSPGSTWMSLARSLMACAMSRFTNRTIGASSSCSSSVSVNDSDWVDSTFSSIVDRELAELFVGAQEPLEHLRQRVFGDDDGLDEQVGDARDVVERDDVVRVENADRQAVAATVDRDELSTCGRGCRARARRCSGRAACSPDRRTDARCAARSPRRPAPRSRACC